MSIFKRKNDIILKFKKKAFQLSETKPKVFKRRFLTILKR